MTNRKYEGKSLFELFQDIRIREKIFGKYCINKKEFLIIIKIIDAKDNLSVQVHPSDSNTGKNELWYIVECNKSLQE